MNVLEEFLSKMFYELSWSRTNKQFRFTDQTGEEIYCGKNAPCIGAVGSFTVLSTENSQGRLQVECDALTSHFTIPCPDSYGVLWSQQDIHHVEIPEGAVELEGAGYWRVCFRRKKDKETKFVIPGDWRIRDEKGDQTMTYVNTIRGQFGLDWHDMQSHLFHKGKIYLYDDDAYFVQSPYLSVI